MSIKSYKSTDHVFVLVRANIDGIIPSHEDFMELMENDHSKNYLILGMTELSDDLWGYLSDITKRIPSENPCYQGAERDQFGLNQGGLTLLTEKSKECLLEILDSLPIPPDKRQKIAELAGQINHNQYIFHYGI